MAARSRGWCADERDDGSSRFTTSSRLAYVELTVPSGRDTSGALVDLAAAIKKTVPEGIAD